MHPRPHDAVSPQRPRRRPRPASVGAAWLGGAAMAQAQTGTAAPASGTPLVALLCLLAFLLGAAVAAWAAWRQQRLAAELREARGQLQTLGDLLDAWQWQTDAQHRLTLWRPPEGKAGSDPVAASALLARPLWDIFKAEDASSLQQWLQSAAPLQDIAVKRSAGAGGGVVRGVLRGRVRADAQGNFAGYAGTWREVEAPAPAAAVPATAALPEPAAAAGDSDHESFSYTVSHDLRAPIRVVEGFTKIVKEDYGRLLDRVGNDHLDRVLGAAARMNSMIDALLALSKLSSQPLARQPVNLSQLGAYVADDLRRQAPDREVRIDIEPGLQALGDPTLLRVVLENLMGNAWKYTAKNTQAHISLARSAERPACFAVHDNGAGFDMRFADRLFGVFQRLHSANDFPGTGVGLASVRRIIRRHGGEIWGEAEVNRGAHFHFSLPAPLEGRQ